MDGWLMDGKQVTKTVADKILKELGEKKSIGMNSTNADKKGSQFVFWTLQVRSRSHSHSPFPHAYTHHASLISNPLVSLYYH